MKNQFVADINDYFKYGLLRLLARRPGLSSLGIWWMLTDDDAGAHGGKPSYLDKEGKHSVCDNELFKALKRIRGQENRGVISVQKNDVIPKALFWPNANLKKNGDGAAIAEGSHQKLIDAGKSLVIYQHKPQRQSLDEILPQLIGQARELTAANAFGIACGNGLKKGEVGFLLVPQIESEQQFRAAARDYLDAYKSFARMVSHRGATNG